MIAMSDHYDRLESRTQSARESALFRDLRHVLTVSKPRAPALRTQLKGIEIASLQSRDDLVRIPMMSHHRLEALQAETSPLGGLAAARVGAFRKIFIGPGAMASSEGHAKDWWGLGRGLFAAGLRKGSLVLNCFAYDLLPHGHMIESGAAAIGCPVIPAGNASLDTKLEAVARLRPSFFCGPVEHLKAILDHAADYGRDVSFLKNALVTGIPSAGLRNELDLRGVAIRCALMLPELGLVAFETGSAGNMCVAEGLIVEIVTAQGTPVKPGAEGEIVVSRINPDYPLLRYATGMSSVALTPSAAGYTNMRLRMPREIAPQSALCGDTCIHTAQVTEIRRHHPDAGPMHLVIGSLREKDALRLRVERRGNAAIVGESLSETLHRVTRVRGTVEFVEPGSLSDDDAMIVDERPLN